MKMNEIFGLEFFWKMYHYIRKTATSSSRNASLFDSHYWLYREQS